jgi:hypothetical protein
MEVDGLKPMQGLPEGTLQVRVAARQGPLRETLAGSERSGGVRVGPTWRAHDAFRVDESIMDPGLPGPCGHSISEFLRLF